VSDLYLLNLANGTFCLFSLNIPLLNHDCVQVSILCMARLYRLILITGIKQVPINIIIISALELKAQSELLVSATVRRPSVLP